MNRQHHTKMTTQQMTLAAVMAAILCILGPLSIPIPISPVPLTLTNFAIYLTVGLLGWKAGTISYLVYLFLGLAGLPVFSGFSAGFGRLLGPTGGYLIGFIFMSLFCGAVIEKCKKNSLIFLGMMIGTLIAYLFGTLWLSYQAQLSFIQALWCGVIPYIPGDLLKIFISVLLIPPIRKRLLCSHILS